MARLNHLKLHSDDEGELPDIDELLCYNSSELALGKAPTRLPKKHVAEQRKPIGKPQPESSTDVKETRKYDHFGSVIVKDPEDIRGQKDDSAPRALSPVSGNVGRFHGVDTAAKGLQAVNTITAARTQTAGLRTSPRKIVSTPGRYRVPSVKWSDSETSEFEEDDTFTDLSGFIVSDSENLPQEPIVRAAPRRLRKGLKPAADRRDEQHVREASPELGQPFTALSLQTSTTRRYVSDSQKSSEGYTDEEREAYKKQTATKLEELEDQLAVLRFSPPSSKSPYKIKSDECRVTPPSTPQKSKLQSPSKRLRIPQTPHRPSVDAFWSQEVIDTWNDDYSPAKAPKSIRRPNTGYLSSDDEDLDEPPLSPSKSPTKRTTSPMKTDRAAREKRLAFDATKHDLATAFLAEVDNAITDGQIARLAAETGGIKLLWSKKLTTTAGRANWRRETIRQRYEPTDLSTESASTDLVPTSTTKIKYRHHASIELAEKIIDDETRLRNTIAHEYCHLANFMVSGIKDQPHGREFKVWAAKVTNHFRSVGVQVTTKHSYEIDFKYVWECGGGPAHLGKDVKGGEEGGGCGTLYQRHSKSIDTEKQRCGKCKGRLTQIKPVPRGVSASPKKKKNKGGDGCGEDAETRAAGSAEHQGKQRTEYQDYIKREYQRVKQADPARGFGEIMTVLGREFREMKKSREELEKKVEASVNVDGMLKEVDAVVEVRELGDVVDGLEDLKL